MSLSSVLEARFDEPVFAAQSTFRAVMNALANPGRTFSLPALGVPAPLPDGLAAIALALIDSDTPLWCDPTIARADGLDSWIDFHLAAPRASSPSNAAFALCTDAQAMPSLSAFGHGTDEYPDRSTTIILHLPALAGGAARVLTGPGIESTRTIAPLGLPPDIVAQWSDNRALYPRGVDLLLVSGAEIMGLLRTTRIAEGA